MPNHKILNRCRAAGWAFGAAAALAVVLTAAAPNARAQSGLPAIGTAQSLPAGSVDARTLGLLRQMRRAEHTLTLSGEQVTVLFSDRGRPPEQSEQTIYFDSGQGLRCEYHLPKRISGQLIVSNAQGYWHFMPQRHLLVVGPARPRRIGAPIGATMRALRGGAAQASFLGGDTVAGRLVDVVVVSSAMSPGIPTAKLWIDPATGAQLRTEVYDALGGLRSVSYFTQVNYSPSFPPGAFDAPVVPPGTTMAAQSQPSKLNRLPTDAEAGFHVLVPATLPPGYVFESASVFHYAAGGGQAVTLRYRSNWNILSLFERNAGGNAAQNTPPASPRAGTVVVHRNGMQLIAIGSLGNGDLVTVLNSMR